MVLNLGARMARERRWHRRPRLHVINRMRIVSRVSSPPDAWRAANCRRLLILCGYSFGAMHIPGAPPAELPRNGVVPGRGAPETGQWTKPGIIGNHTNLDGSSSQSLV